ELRSAHFDKLERKLGSKKTVQRDAFLRIQKYYYFEEPPLVFLGDPSTWALVEATLWHLSPVKLQRDTLITSKPPWEVQELHGVLGGDFPEEKYTVWSFSARNRKFEKLPLERFRCQYGDKYEFFYLLWNGNQGREEAAVFNDLSFQDALDTFPDEVRLVARETTRDSGKPSSTSAHSPAQPLSSHEELVKLVTELKDGFFQPMDACSKSWHGEDGFERRLGECMAPDALDAFKDKDEVTLLMRKAEMSDSRKYSSTSIEKAGPQDSCQASAAEARMVAWKVGVKNTFINCDEGAGDPADSDPQHGTAPAVLQQIMPNDGS
ncbi:unnamed protein product, partial [Effrenium voratum]